MPRHSWADNPESDIGFRLAGTELGEMRLMNFAGLTQRGIAVNWVLPERRKNSARVTQESIRIFRPVLFTIPQNEI